MLGGPIHDAVSGFGSLQDWSACQLSLSSPPGWAFLHFSGYFTPCNYEQVPTTRASSPSFTPSGLVSYTYTFRASSFVLARRASGASLLHAAAAEVGQPSFFYYYLDSSSTCHSLWGVLGGGRLSPAHTTIWQGRDRIRSPKLVFLAGSNALQSVGWALLYFPGEVPGPRFWVLELVMEGSAPLTVGGGRSKGGTLPLPRLLHQRWGSWYQLCLTYTLMAGSFMSLFTGSTLLVCPGEAQGPFFLVWQLEKRLSQVLTCYRWWGATEVSFLPLRAAVPCFPILTPLGLAFSCLWEQG